jgi:hypothetical protein
MAYDTKLSPNQEQSFQSWKKKNAPNDSGQDYDLRGAYKEGLTRDPSNNHFSDRYKKPNHPTFSDQSIYAKDAPSLAGHWEGDNYIETPQHRAAMREQYENDKYGK